MGLEQPGNRQERSNKMERVTTTFWQDFNIADAFGIPAIEDTCKRSLDDWGDDIRYLTELIMVLNHKIWLWYAKWKEHPENEFCREYSQTYNDLWEKAEQAVWDGADSGKFSAEEIKFFLRVTD